MSFEQFTKNDSPSRLKVQPAPYPYRNMLDNLSEYHKLSNDDTESRLTATLGSFKGNPLDN